MAMAESARMVASAAATWAIVIVSVASVVSWLILVAIAARRQNQASRRSRLADLPGPLRSDMPIAEPTPDEQLPDVVRQLGNPVPAARTPADETPQAAPARGQPAGQAVAGASRPPAQRSGESDRAGPSLTRPGTPKRDEH